MSRLAKVWLILPCSEFTNDIEDWTPGSVFERWEDAVARIKAIDDEQSDDVEEFKVEPTPDEVTVTCTTGEVCRVIAVPVEYNQGD